MPQDTHHPLYDAMIRQWTRCRDAMQGTDAIKQAGETYLPKPSGMNAQEYASYIGRAGWFGASARTIQGLLGMVFRQEATVTVPVTLEPHLADITRTGISFTDFSELYLQELLLIGHTGVLIDYPAEGGLRPQWKLYPAESVINWREGTQEDGTIGLQLVVLAEYEDISSPADHYVHTVVPQWRELALEDGIYVQRLWRKSPGISANMQLIGETIPLRAGEPLTFLPFHSEVLWRVSEQPPILDVVDVNISHYRTSADYEHDLHMTCMKTPYIIGWSPENGELRMGGLAAWTIPLPRTQVEVGILEPNGASLQAKLDKLKAAEEHMAVLGARMLEPARKSVEATLTHQLRRSGEESILQSIVRRASANLSQLLQWHAWWAVMVDSPQDATIQVALNKDFQPQTLAPQELDSLVAAYQAGALSIESLWYNLDQGERLAPDEDLITFIARLETQAVERNAALE